MIKLNKKQQNNRWATSQNGASQALTDFLFILLIAMVCTLSVLAKKQMVDHAILVEEFPKSTEVSHEQIDEIPVFEMDELSDVVSFEGRQFDSLDLFAEHFKESGLEDKHTKVRFKLERGEPSGDFLDAEQFFLNYGISVFLRKGSKDEQ